MLGIRVGDLETKESLLAEQATAFTTSHFDGYPMVLSRLDELGAVDLPELVELAWLAKAPKRLGHAVAHSKMSGSADTGPRSSRSSSAWPGRSRCTCSRPDRT